MLLRRARRRGPSTPQEREQTAALIDALVERYRRVGPARRRRPTPRPGCARCIATANPSTKIRARLAAKGVESSVAAEAVLGLRAETADPDLAAACAFARRRRLGPYRRAAADPARELGAFARAGFGRRVADRVLACADIEAVEALARAGPD